MSKYLDDTGLKKYTELVKAGIKEASDKADAADAKAVSAQEAAKSADAKAVQAQTDATSAKQSAESAVSTAESAETAAGEAVTKAESAETKALDAVSKAEQAIQTAESGGGDASAAVETANEAKSTAESAKDVADAASATANSASEKAAANETAIQRLDSEQDSQDARLQALEDADNNWLPKSGGTMTGNINMNENSIEHVSFIRIGTDSQHLDVENGEIEYRDETNQISNLYFEVENPASRIATSKRIVLGHLGNGTETDSSVNKGYVDDADALAMPKNGGTFTGNVRMAPSARLSGILTPEGDSDAVNKKYVDESVKLCHFSHVTSFRVGFGSFNVTVKASQAVELYAYLNGSNAGESIDSIVFPIGTMIKFPYGDNTKLTITSGIRIGVVDTVGIRDVYSDIGAEFTGYSVSTIAVIYPTFEG